MVGIIPFFCVENAGFIELFHLHTSRTMDDAILVDDDAHMPPYHPNCRCAIKAVVKKDKEKEPAKLRKKPETRVPKVEPNITSVNADRQIPDFSQMKTMSEIEDGLRATFGKDIVIDENNNLDKNKYVSRAHARIGYSENIGFYLQVEYGGSRLSGNRTRIFRDEEKIEVENVDMKEPLHDGDLIELGKAVLLQYKEIK